mgnify:CR=1 FL=1
MPPSSILTFVVFCVCWPRTVIATGDVATHLGTLGLWTDHSYAMLDASVAYCRSTVALPGQIVSVPGELVKITTPELNAAVYTLVGDWASAGIVRRVSGIWVYGDDTPVTYFNWLPGEPNDMSGGEDTTQYQVYASILGWNDARDANRQFVCQFPDIDVACASYCNRRATSSSWNSLDSCLCTCDALFGGEKCDRCATGRHGYPTCNMCLIDLDCNVLATSSVTSDGASCTCLCKPGAAGPRCETCLPNHAHWPTCPLCTVQDDCNGHATSAASNGSSPTCTCVCLRNYAGASCNRCSKGFARYHRCVSVTESLSAEVTASWKTTSTNLTATRGSRSGSDSNSASLGITRTRTVTFGKVTFTKTLSWTRGSISPSRSCYVSLSAGTPSGSRSSSPSAGTPSASFTLVEHRPPQSLGRTVTQIGTVTLLSTWVTSPASLTSGIRVSSLTRSSSCGNDMLEPPSAISHPVGFPIGKRVQNPALPTASPPTNEPCDTSAVDTAATPINFFGGRSDVRCMLNFHRGAVLWQVFAVLPVLVCSLSGIWIIAARRKGLHRGALDGLRVGPRLAAMAKLPSTVATAMIFVSDAVTQSSMLLLCVGLGMNPASIPGDTSVAGADISMLAVLGIAYVALVAASLWHLTGSRLASVAVDLSEEDHSRSCMPACATFLATGGARWVPRSHPEGEIRAESERHTPRSAPSAATEAFHRSFKALFDDLRFGRTWFHAWDTATCVACNIIAGVRSTSPTVCLSCKYALSAIFAVHLLLVSVTRPYAGLVAQVQALLVSALALVASLLLSFGRSTDGDVADWIVVISILLPVVRLPFDVAVLVANHCTGCKQSRKQRQAVGSPLWTNRPLPQIVDVHPDDHSTADDAHEMQQSILPMAPEQRSLLGNLDRPVQDEIDEVVDRDSIRDTTRTCMIDSLSLLMGEPVLPSVVAMPMASLPCLTDSDADDPLAAMLNRRLLHTVYHSSRSAVLPRPLDMAHESLACSSFLDDMLGNSTPPVSTL